MSVNFEDVKTLTDTVNKQLPAHRFLTSFFAPVNLRTLDARLDVIENTNTIAPFKREGAKNTLTTRQGFTQRSFHCYEIGLDRPTTAMDVFKAQPGEPSLVVDPMSPDQRQAVILGRDTTELNNRINRTIEVLSSRALFEGGYAILDEEGKKIDSIDFGFAEDHKLIAQGSSTWAGANADVTGDLDKLEEVVGTDSNKSVGDYFFGAAAWSAAKKSKAFIKNFDAINVVGNKLELGAPRTGLGARLVGVYNGARVWLYDGAYNDGEKKLFVPTDKVLALGEGADLKLYFGCVGNNKDGFFVGERFSKLKWNDEEEVYKLSIKSRPLPVIREAEAIAWAKVL